MAYNPPPTADFDPAYASYPTQPFPQHPYPSNHAYSAFSQPSHHAQLHAHTHAQAQVHQAHAHAQALTHAQSPYHYASQQQYGYGLPNQARGHAPAPGHMPPPSSIPYYQQPSPKTQIPTAPSAGPVSTFPAPSQNRDSPQVQAPPQSPQHFRDPPLTSQQPQPTMTTTTTKPVPPPSSVVSTPPSDHGKSALTSTVPPSLEAQRVSALLELNRVLLQEVVRDVAAQDARRAASNPPQTQPNLPSTTAEASTSTTAQSKADTTASTKPENEPAPEDSKSASSNQPPSQQPQSQNQKVPHTKEYVEYMRRLQANLAYLASVADRHHKPGNAVPPFPAIMEAPNLPSLPEKEREAERKFEGEDGDADGRASIRILYAKLRELWPEYKGKGPGPGPGPATTTTATATTTSAAVGTIGAVQTPLVMTSAA